MSKQTLLRYPGTYGPLAVPSTTRACIAPDPMLRAAFIFALVTPGRERCGVYYQRTGESGKGIVGDTAHPLATVADFAVGAWILVEQTPDGSGAGALWRLGCVGEWANP